MAMQQCFGTVQLLTLWATFPDRQTESEWIFLGRPCSGSPSASLSFSVAGGNYASSSETLFSPWIDNDDDIQLYY